MSVGRVFKKIFVDGIFNHLIKIGKFIARIDDIPVIGDTLVDLIGLIPVAGPVLKLAVEKVEMAEALFASGQGKERKIWAINKLEEDLKRLNIKEKYIEEIIGYAFLYWKGYAAVMTKEDFNNGFINTESN